MNPRPYAFAAAAIFLIAAGYDLSHVLRLEPFGSLALVPSLVIAVLDAVVWALAAWAVLVRWRARGARRAAFVVSAFGALLLLVHGIVLRGPLALWSGIPFMVVAPLQAVLVIGAFTPFPWRRREVHPDPTPHLEHIAERGGRSRPVV